MFKVAILNLLLFFLGATQPIAGGLPQDTPPHSQLKVLLDYATRTSFDRESFTADWNRYKNGISLHPRLIDLSTPSPNVCQTLLETRDRVDWGTVGQPTEYELQVLSLRKGDSVRFGRRTFTLGDFVGAGNATHIFRLIGEAGLIRIPFLYPQAIGQIARKLLPPPKLIAGQDGFEQQEQKRRVRTILALSLKFKQGLTGKMGAITVLERDRRGRFNIVEEINGTENGTDFLKSICSQSYFFPGETLFYPGCYLNPTDPSQLEKLRQLIDLMKHNGGADQNIGSSDAPVTPIDTAAARQYIWDENGTHPRWRLVDAE